MSLASDIVSIPAVPAGPRVEALVGDTLSFAPQQTFAAGTYTLLRAPAGSAAAFGAGSSLTFDLPGMYRAQIQAGGYGRVIEVIAFPAAVLNQQTGWGAAAHPITRTHLRGCAMDPRVTEASCAATLEAETPTYSGLVEGTGNMPGVAWSNYGN